MRQQTSREQMAGRGAGDGLAQYAGGKLRSRLCESLRERICLEETVSCTASTVVRMCPSNFAKTVFIKISKSFSSETPCSATVYRPHTAPAHPLPAICSSISDNTSPYPQDEKKTVRRAHCLLCTVDLVVDQLVFFVIPAVKFTDLLANLL